MQLNKQFWMAAALSAATILIQNASADIDTPRIDNRQANQQRQIEQGIHSGALTNREATRLQHQQDRIEHMEQRAEADGIVTRHENARLTHQQNKADRTIARKKHNLRRQ